MNRYSFPNLLESFAIVIILFTLQIVIAVLIYDPAEGYDSGYPLFTIPILLISTGIVISIIMYYKQLNYASLFNQSGSSLKSQALVLALPIALVSCSAVVWISDLSTVLISLKPLSERQMLIFHRTFTSGLASVLLICFIAPVLEEMLFRGIILRGLLHHYTGVYAIALNALIFSMYHMNFYQIPVTLTLGCFTGWLYYKTRSLWPTIMAHVIYNSSVYLYFILDNTAEENKLTFIPQYHGPAILLASLICSYLGLKLLAKILNKARD